jgi:hypothetical protein
VVTRFYTIDTANERLPEVRDLLERLRAQRLELIGLRDLAIERLRSVRAAAGVDASATDEDAERGLVEGDAELRAIRLRMQGVIDQMQAAVTRLDEWDVSLRDIETGLIDFPALASGRQVWLCWRLGEGPVEWWHELTTGFGGRRPIIDLT